MPWHPGINITRLGGAGLAGLPGLLMTIAFVLLFAGIFIPRESGNWFWLVFLVVESVAAILYILCERRSRKESERLNKELHRINEHSDR